MTIEEMESVINYWSEWASSDKKPRYDIALFKICVKFEKFLSDLFVSYSIGEPSEKGYLPERLLKFRDKKQLEAFIRLPSKAFVDYPTQIRNLSKHIFKNNPFDVIFCSSNYNSTYLEIIAIRNYVAHESGEAQRKLIDLLFQKREDKFVEPSEYLTQKKKHSNKSVFTYYADSVREMSKLLIEEVT